MNYLFFDTETNGLPKDWKAPHTKTDNWPQLVQIAWTITSDRGEPLRSQEYLIKPTFELNAKAQETHGKTKEELEQGGVDIKHALTEFQTDLNFVGTIVAHNLNFDRPVVLAEFERAGIKTAFDMRNQICSMLKTVNVCKLPGKYGKTYKWPKLQELYFKLFNGNFEDAHDAMADVNALVMCFWELKRNKLI